MQCIQIMISLCQQCMNIPVHPARASITDAILVLHMQVYSAHASLFHTCNLIIHVHAVCVPLPPGFTFHSQMDSPGYTYYNRRLASNYDPAIMATACSQDPLCMAFSYNGDFKSQLAPSSAWLNVTASKCLGLYVKIPGNTAYGCCAAA
jgi:hypothetical protein